MFSAQPSKLYKLHPKQLKSSPTEDGPPIKDVIGLIKQLKRLPTRLGHPFKEVNELLLQLKSPLTSPNLTGKRSHLTFSEILPSTLTTSWSIE